MSDAREKRKLAAIMFTDMVGYSALSQRDGKLAVELLEEHRQILRGIFPRFDGTEIKTIGDAFLVEFSSALEAAQCAIEIQRTLAHRDADAPADRQIQVRIGIHIGDVIHRENDVYGDGVNIASRIEPLASPGGICLSMDVERQIRNAVETRFEKLAPTELKNISVPMDLFRIVLPWEHGKEEGKRKKEEASAKSSNAKWIAVAAVAMLLIGAGWWWTSPGPRKSTLVSSPARRMTPQSADVPEKSIAVLPFENLSEDKSNAFFAEGIQDEILTRLSKIADLKVISRSSTQKYKSAPDNLREVGQQLGVAHLLEGSVQKIANQVRVNAQLIDARNDAHSWAQTYDRNLADVFAIQSEIAQAIAEQLQAQLSPNERAEIAKAPTSDPIAYDLFVRARELDDMTNAPDAKGRLLQGISLLEEALRRDPKFLRAYCLMAETHLDLYWSGAEHTEQRRDLARVALQKAEELQPDAGEVHWIKATYAYHGFRDYETARKELEVAKKLLPNAARLYVLAGAVDRRSGHLPEAEVNFKRAVELDPRNFIVLMEAASTLQGMRRYSEATSLYERALSVQSSDAFASFLLGFNVFARTGDVAGLRKPLDRLVQQGGDAARSAAFPILVCSWLERNKSEAEKAIAQIPAEGVADSFAEASIPREYCVGRTAWLFGDKEQAKSALTAARAIFERTTKEQPDYAQAWTYLGLTDAMLGRCDDAIREGKRACEVLPFSKDSWVGALWITNLAAIYTWCGDKEAALHELETSVKLPVGVNYGELKQSPDWDALRGDPRFERIVQSLAPQS